MNLNDLRDACHATSKSKGFHEPGPSVGEAIALIHSELSEALEDHRAGLLATESLYVYPDEKPAPAWLREASAPCFENPDGSLNKPCGIPSEMADVVIRVLDFCGQHAIDIERAVREKMRFNETRPRRHGGKVL